LNTNDNANQREGGGDKTSGPKTCDDTANANDGADRTNTSGRKATDLNANAIPNDGEVYASGKARDGNDNDGGTTTTSKRLFFFSFTDYILTIPSSM
jgi:hypothetical protein